MAISTKKLVAIGGVLFISVMLSFALLYTSIVPQYSVGEFYVNKDKSSLVDKKIQLVGDVHTWNATSGVFSIMDWEGYNYTVTVYYHNVVIPGGFTIGKRVVVEGILKTTNGAYSLQADMISTKCPSKYENTTTPATTTAAAS